MWTVTRNTYDCFQPNLYKCRRSSVLKIVLSNKFLVHRVTPKWPWTLQGQSYPTCITTVRESSRLWDTGHFETSALNGLTWPWTLQSQITLYMFNWYPWFRSTTSRFQDTVHFNTSPPNDPKMTFSTTRSYAPHIHVTSIYESQISRLLLLSVSLLWRTVFWNTSKIYPFRDKCNEWPQINLDPYITLFMQNNCPRVSNFTQFHSTTSRFWNTGQVHRITPTWPWTVQGQRYTINVLLVSQSPKFHSGLLYDQPFSKYCTFYNSPLTTMLNAPQTNNIRIAKNSKFQISLFLNNFGRHTPGSIHEFWGATLVHTFRGDIVWNFYSHMVAC